MHEALLFWLIPLATAVNVVLLVLVVVIAIRAQKASEGAGREVRDELRRRVRHVRCHGAGRLPVDRHEHRGVAQSHRRRARFRQRHGHASRGREPEDAYRHRSRPCSVQRRRPGFDRSDRRAGLAALQQHSVRAAAHAQRQVESTRGRQRFREIRSGAARAGQGPCAARGPQALPRKMRTVQSAAPASSAPRRRCWSR